MLRRFGFFFVKMFLYVDRKIMVEVYTLDLKNQKNSAAD